MELKFNLWRVKPGDEIKANVLQDREHVQIVLSGDKDLVESVFNILRSEKPFNVE